MNVSQYHAQQNHHFRKELWSGDGFQEALLLVICLDDVCNVLEKKQTGGQKGGVQGLIQPSSSLSNSIMMEK